MSHSHSHPNPPYARLTWLLAAWLCGASTLHAQSAPSAAAQTPAHDPLGAIVHVCPSGLLGGNDGGTGQIRGGTDGGTGQIKGGTDGKKGGASSAGAAAIVVTSPVHADLGISNVLATKSGVDYRLTFCVVNRGGQPAYGPTTVQVRVGGVVLSQETDFTTIASKRSVCFGDAKNIEYNLPSLEGMTIAVTAAANEYSTRDNLCRVNWK